VLITALPALLDRLLVPEPLPPVLVQHTVRFAPDGAGAEPSVVEVGVQLDAQRYKHVDTARPIARTDQHIARVLADMDTLGRKRDLLQRLGEAPVAALAAALAANEADAEALRSLLPQDERSFMPEAPRPPAPAHPRSRPPASWPASQPCGRCLASAPLQAALQRASPSR